MTLTIQDLGARGELLGSVAVLVTLEGLRSPGRGPLPLQMGATEQAKRVARELAELGE